MTNSIKRFYKLLSSSYFFIFFSFGAIFPLLTVYFDHIGLNGKEIGFLTSIGPIVTIVTQPLWGMIADRYQIQRKILYFAILFVILVAFLFPWSQSFIIIALLIVLFHAFQSPITPIADSIALNFVQSAGISYGDIRLWGAIGFAISVFVTGNVANKFGHSSIFYIFMISLSMSIIFFRQIPKDEENRTHVNVFSGLKEVMRLPYFLFFLLSSFFIFGPMNANNYYFGIYYQHIGGTLAGIGLVFLFASGSEAPMMRVASRIIGKVGLENTILFAACVSFIRWVIFYSVHNPIIIFIVFFLQGLSIGLFLTSAPQYVRTYTPKTIQVTALTVYTAFGNGIGTFVCNLIGGWIYDQSSIINTYLFFAGFTILGVIFILLTKRFTPKQMKE